MDDLVARLKNEAQLSFGRSPDSDDWFRGDLCSKAADAIEELQRQLAEARGLIEDLCDELEPYVEEKWGYDERLKRQYDRDMEPAVKGRAYLERLGHD